MATTSRRFFDHDSGEILAEADDALEEAENTIEAMLLHRCQAEGTNPAYQVDVQEVLTAIRKARREISQRLN